MSHPPADGPAEFLAGGDLARLIAGQIARCPHPAPLGVATDDADAARCDAALQRGLWRMAIAQEPAQAGRAGGDTAWPSPAPGPSSPVGVRPGSWVACLRQDRGARMLVPGAGVPAVDDAADPCHAPPGRTLACAGPGACAD